MERELSQQGGHDEHARMEISSYKSRISELQSQLAKLAKQVGHSSSCPVELCQYLSSM